MANEPGWQVPFGVGYF